MSLFEDTPEGQAPPPGEPGVITSITPTKRNPDRLSIKVDKRYVIALDRDTVAALALTVGMPWQDSTQARADRARETEKANAFALRSLTRRMQTEGTLRDKLRKRGNDDPTIDRVLDEMRRIGLVDDQACAEALVRETMRAKPAGRRFLLAKLRQKKVPAEIASAVIDEALSQTDQREDATTLALKRARTFPESLEPPKARQRLYAYLARRGFDSDACMAAVQTALQSRDKRDPIDLP